MAKATMIHPGEVGEQLEAFAISGGKWTLVLISRLGNGKQRFNELRRQLSGISQKTLTATLRALERDGFVERTLFATIPPRVEYELTGPGLELLEMTLAWDEFIRRHQDYIEMSRRRFVEATGTEAPARVVVGRGSR